jgi:ribosomal protein S18 acetylase RimI-like enzyme
LACDGVQVLGFAAVQFGESRAILTLLCVQPAMHRRRIARRLTEWLRESTRIAGIASIQVELRADHAPALAFYCRLGP